MPRSSPQTPDLTRSRCTAVSRPLCFLNDFPFRANKAEIMEGGRSLLGLFGRKDDDVRASAAWALGRFRSPAAREALTRALKDSSPSVRSSAKMGLKG